MMKNNKALEMIWKESYEESVDSKFYIKNTEEFLRVLKDENLTEEFYKDLSKKPNMYLIANDYGCTVAIIKFFTERWHLN